MRISRQHADVYQATVGNYEAHFFDIQRDLLQSSVDGYDIPNHSLGLQPHCRIL